MTTCAYCGTRTISDLCGVCAVGVTSAYYEANTVILDAYAARGFEQIEASLAHHTEFNMYLEAKGLR